MPSAIKIQQVRTISENFWHQVVSLKAFCEQRFAKSIKHCTVREKLKGNVQQK
jgi:hypothetical protein